MSHAPGARTAALSYDPMGRLRQTVGGLTTQFLYDGDALVAEYDGAGALLRRYVHGPGVDEPVAWYEGASTADRRFLHANHQGSIVAVTNASGTTLGLNAYDAYGIANANNLGRFQYTGQITIPEVGVYHYKARAYSPTLGRFLQTDPIGYDDQINLYAYVGNDPVNMVDPSGLCTEQETQVGPDGALIVTGHCPPPPPPPPPPSPPPPTPARKTTEEKAPPQNNDLPKCNAVQRGGQALGQFAVDIGGAVTQFGIGGSLLGSGIAAGSAATLNPAGVLIGGGIATGSANVTAGGGLITAGGATLMALSGSGKAAVTELVTRGLTRFIPSSTLKDVTSEALSPILDKVIPELRSCQ